MFWMLVKTNFGRKKYGFLGHSGLTGMIMLIQLSTLALLPDLATVFIKHAEISPVVPGSNGWLPFRAVG